MQRPGETATDFDWRPDVRARAGDDRPCRVEQAAAVRGMVDFWSNHLNVANPGDNGWDNRHDYDRTVIRKHALGRFDGHAASPSATHPAMLHYLNNADSTKDNPNENYGRELLELHTVGVDGGYTEEDMRQSALIMTGFGGRLGDRRLFEYNKGDHYRGRCRCMGFSATNDRAATATTSANDYVRYLARHPRPPQHIAYKLVSGSCPTTRPPALVDTLAADLPRERHRDRPGAAPAVHSTASSRPRSARRFAGRSRTWSRRCGCSASGRQDAAPTGSRGCTG